MATLKEVGTVGVIIARFQVDELHEGHRYLVDFVQERHDDVLICIGVTAALPTPHDPLSFSLRREMVEQTYAGFRIVPVPDHPSDEAWSKTVDAIIAREFPWRKAVLYGSRNSFLPHYTGMHATYEIPTIEARSGTDLRNDIAKAGSHTADFRRGIIHTVTSRLPVTYPAVDVAIIRPETGEVLLAAKQTDGDKLRFIGGFVDPKDPSYERAARREAYEETSGMELADYRYLGSARIKDWRYEGTGDGIMTTFFRAQYIFGALCPADDIVHLEWVRPSDLRSRLISSHEELGEMLLRSLAADTKA